MKRTSQAKAASKTAAPVAATRQNNVVKSGAGSQTPPARKRRNWPILEAALILVLIKMVAGAFYIWNRPGPSFSTRPDGLGIDLSAKAGPAAEPADYLGVALKAAQPAQAQAAAAPAGAGAGALSAGALMVVGGQSAAGLPIPLPPDGDELLRPAPRPPQAPPPRLGTGGPPANPGDYEALRSLREREQELARREAFLTSRAGALSALEADLNKRLADVEISRREIEAMLKRNEAILAEQRALAEEKAKDDEAAKDLRLQHLVAAYGGMKAEQAGNLINSMDDEVAVAILSAMPGGKAGKIMAMVNPDKAARLTKAISEKRIDPSLLLNEEADLPM
ncbi:MAG: hypothetical protein FWG97_05780 [Deltaproteobacteria bacterium]|nr:hypothetical protein [Deltaproteobacteria bacterium]